MDESERLHRRMDGRMKKERQRTFGAIWGWPLVLGTLTSVGLVSALFSDGGFGDLLAGVCLAAPVLACLWYGWLRRGSG